MTARSFEELTSFASLYAAFRRSRRAKRGKGGEPAFYFQLERNLLTLQADLRADRWRPSPYRYFTIHHTKDRVVAEAVFADRVVHHALVAAIEPAFEPHFIADSFACRRGKGLHLAVRRAQQLARCHRFVLRLDVRRYFDNMDHAALLKLLARRIDDHAILRLCAHLLVGAAVPHVPSDERRGVPIGNLTSQFWANVYLDPIDQLVTTLLGAGNYLRYMDDIAVFADDKTVIWQTAAAIEQMLTAKLRLTLKSKATVLTPTHEGVAWLGTRVFPATIRLDAASKRRLCGKLRASARRERRDDDPHSGTEPQRAASLCAHAALTNSLQLRRSVLAAIARQHSTDP